MSRQLSHSATVAGRVERHDRPDRTAIGHGRRSGAGASLAFTAERSWTQTTPPSLSATPGHDDDTSAPREQSDQLADPAAHPGRKMCGRAASRLPGPCVLAMCCRHKCARSSCRWGQPARETFLLDPDAPVPRGGRADRLDHRPACIFEIALPGPQPHQEQPGPAQRRSRTCKRLSNRPNRTARQLAEQLDVDASRHEKSRAVSEPAGEVSSLIAENTRVSSARNRSAQGGPRAGLLFDHRQARRTGSLD